ncbi:MAG: glutamine-hydrolyzing GMP synthase [Firmicutes bacterium]|nr:glutamine-hydrolyzing GMP synthase [Bacillota bacterium]
MEVKRVLDKMSVQQFVDEQVSAIRQKVGKDKVLLGLSGGVDSSVCAGLLAKAVPGQAVCIFVDTGLMRLGEADKVKKAFAGKDLQLVVVDAEKRFLDKLKGVTDPNQKRMIIGEEFVRVFEEEAAKLGKFEWLSQGTIYPDILESNGKNAVKPHHNAGGFPKETKFKGLVEPLYYLYKEEVRQVARALGLGEELSDRQPFPGPGLGVRCIGELTKEKLDILRVVDDIVVSEIDKLKDRPKQYFAILTGVKATGVKETSEIDQTSGLAYGARVYDYVACIRTINTTDFVTAKNAKLSYEILDKIVTRITKECNRISRVVYDITDKPPATIEWE